MIREIRYPSAGQAVALVERRISWGAVTAGAAFTLAAMITLSLLGGGIGLLAAPGASGAGIGVAAGVWLFLTAVLSYFGGGWIAGRLTGIPNISESVIHGVVMWAFTTVVTLLLLTTALGRGLSSVGHLFGSAIGGAAEIADEGGARDFVQRAQRAVDQAAEGRLSPEGTGERVAKAGGAAGIFAFAAMLFEAFAAAFGARLGTRILRPQADGVGEVRREHSLVR